MTHSEFTEYLAMKGAELYRTMPWRDDTRPYYVLVSEMMLQQTQVTRVIPKFNEFIGTFPSEQHLADASLSEVLKAWQGLGYNRRAKFLHDAATVIAREGAFPDNQGGLLALPGAGINTAGAIRAYSYNQPALFIETNIRTVYIHHFFNDQFDVHDAQIKEKLAETIDHENPREFYWALMDYGSYLKAQGIRNIASSKHYKKQPPLKGSVREVRGYILRELSRSDGETLLKLREGYERDDRFEKAIQGLENEGLIIQKRRRVYLTK